MYGYSRPSHSANPPVRLEGSGPRGCSEYPPPWGSAPRVDFDCRNLLSPCDLSATFSGGYWTPRVRRPACARFSTQEILLNGVTKKRPIAAGSRRRPVAGRLYASGSLGDVGCRPSQFVQVCCSAGLQVASDDKRRRQESGNRSQQPPFLATDSSQSCAGFPHKPKRGRAETGIPRSVSTNMNALIRPRSIHPAPSRCASIGARCCR